MHSQQPAGGTSNPRRWLNNLLVISTAYLLVLIPIVWEEGPRERVRWYVAAAESAWLQGNQAAAIPLLTRAIDLSPKSGELWLRRAEWHRDLGDEQASLSDASRALEGAEGMERVELLLQRAELLQHLQLWREAVDDWKEIRRLSDAATRGSQEDNNESEAEGINDRETDRDDDQDDDEGDAPREERAISGTSASRPIPRVHLLNGLAYARALAHMELNEALIEATEALREAENSAAILDTRGYILFLLGRREEALADLDKAVSLQNNELRLWRRVYEDQRQQLVDLTVLREMDQMYRRSLAVMLYHRGLALEKTDPEKARRDFEKIQEELGFQLGPDLF